MILVGGLDMKKIIGITFLLTVILLTAYSEQEKGELTRIDVIVEEPNSIHIQDKETLVKAEKIFKQIKWEDKVVNMDMKEDVNIVFLYEVEENMPERLNRYKIWFNENTGTAIIVGHEENQSNQSYAELDKSHTFTFRELLFK